MQVYIARHGQTVSNKARRWQDESDYLNEVGEKQVSLLANRLKKIGFDKIVSSPQARANRTAEIIAKELGISHDQSDLLIEIKKPTELIGRDYGDLEAKKINGEQIKNFHDLEFRYSDEENFSDLKQRGLSALEHITSFSPETSKLLVISHAGFMRIIGGLKIFGPDMTTHQYASLWQASIINTGLNIYDYDPELYHFSWKLVSWNDHSHLEGSGLVTSAEIKRVMIIREAVEKNK